MIVKLTDFFKDKSVLILGFGLEGRSTLKLLKNMPVNKIGIADIKRPENSEELKVCEIFSGENYLSAIENFDIVMKAPGVVLLDKIKREQKEKITSQTDLMLRFNENFIIGVTGTKGKSTTASLIYHILSACGRKTALIGNIGVPPLENIYSPETVIVCEMSCHQLEYVKASPDIAVLLNIYEEHLDHYTNFETYKKAKENIYLFQNKDNLLLYDGELMSEKLLSCPAEKFSCTFGTAQKADISVSENEVKINTLTIPIKSIKTFLPGGHNLYNIAVAMAVCLRLNCDIDLILKAVANFKGLPHRLEYAGIINGAEYINDSISTIPNASISAVRAFPDTDSIIIGGMDRGIDYSELIAFFENSVHNIKNIIVLPDSGYRIADGIKLKESAVYRAVNLKDAVRYSAKVTKVRCILSPAAASYGFYRNFEERGEHFKELVRLLNTE